MSDLALDLGALEASRDLPAAPTGKPEQRRTADLQPNTHNGQLFTESLAEQSISVLAADMAANGQLYPVVVLSDGTIVDGERRWRAAQQLGWGEITVLVAAPLTDDQVLDRVLAACTSTRQMSVRERVRVYQALAMRLQAKRTGEGMDSPNGESPKSWKDAQEQAALQAGFSSHRTAERAEAVFERGTRDIQEQVLSGKLSIWAAWEQIAKRPRVSAGAVLEISKPGTEPQCAGPTANDVQPAGVEQTHDQVAEAGPATPSDPNSPETDEDAPSSRHLTRANTPPRRDAVSRSPDDGEEPDDLDDDEASEDDADDEDGVERHLVALEVHLRCSAAIDKAQAMRDLRAWVTRLRDTLL